jgi:predicted ribosome quality control (RQC) complex YloA/Tae2 family protein
MSNVDPGATSVVARDYETGEDVTIELDPRLSPSENLDRYFKRYHKGLVGTNMLGQQLEITQTHITETERLRADLAAITEMPALEEFAAKPVVRELLKKHFPDMFRPSRPLKKVPTRKDVPSRLLPRRYRTSDGLEVWVGKSDEGNDYLTTRLASGNDLFFHVEGYPGSHTILRTGGRKDPPQESVLEAAELCAQFSKMKDAKKVDVHVVPIKHVHKPKGAKPGLVYVSNGKSVGLRRDPARLKRILEARIEE